MFVENYVFQCPECGAKLENEKPDVLLCTSCAFRIGYWNSRYDLNLKKIKKESGK